MLKVVTDGEVLVEMMRKDVDAHLGRPADFVGLFPSGAPSIFIDAVARLGASAGIIGGSGTTSSGSAYLSVLAGKAYNIELTFACCPQQLYMGSTENTSVSKCPQKGVE